MRPHRSLRSVIWRIIARLHRFDFDVMLPLLARLPLRIGYAVAALRGHCMSITGLDWRSIALGYRHIRNQSLRGLVLLPLNGTRMQLEHWQRQRFKVEAREEYEAHLVMAGRVQELECTIDGEALLAIHANRDRGLVLLTPHFDSFFLGIAFLEQAGCRIWPLSSAITQDPRVEPAVRAYFRRKYEALANHLNGGRVLEMERGLRHFYRLLAAGEAVLVLADAPRLPGGVGMEIDFLGERRLLAGGALRLACQTDSDMVGFVCRYVEPGRYHLTLSRLGRARDPGCIADIYQFFSEAILSEPGRWWASDLLPDMPPVESRHSSEIV